jgi:hypothetical protein
MRPKKLLPINAVETIIEMRSRGCNEITIASALGAGETTFRKWKESHPEVKAALQLGNAVEENKLVGILHKAAENGNVIAAMFLLKSRHGYVEGKQYEDNRKLQIAVVLPASLTPEQYLQMTSGKPANVIEAIEAD